MMYLAESNGRHVLGIFKIMVAEYLKILNDRHICMSTSD